MPKKLNTTTGNQGNEVMIHEHTTTITRTREQKAESPHQKTKGAGTGIQRGHRGSIFLYNRESISKTYIITTIQ